MKKFIAKNTYLIAGKSDWLKLCSQGQSAAKTNKNKN